MRVVILSVVLAGLAGCGGRPRPPEYAELARSEAVALLRADTSAYRVIYHPGVDLARQPSRR